MAYTPQRIVCTVIKAIQTNVPQDIFMKDILSQDYINAPGFAGFNIH